jgi:hypothetical protein
MERTKLAGVLVTSGLADASSASARAARVSLPTSWVSPRTFECEGGRERSPSEVGSLMRAAGITPGRLRHAGLQMVLEGVAP